MPNQVPDMDKSKRSDVLLEMEAAQSKAFRAFFVGREVEVLFEESKVIKGQTYQIGHTPEYVKVAVKTEEDWTNQIRSVCPAGFLTDDTLYSEF